ncbi:MAG: hypothetical protein AABZ39_03745 [Spirochaetota bacterium]
MRIHFLFAILAASVLSARTIGYTSIERTEGFSEAQIEQLNERIFSRLVDSGYMLTNIGALPRTASESETAKAFGKAYALDMLFVQTLIRGDTYEYSYRLLGGRLGDLIAEKTFSFTDFRTQFPSVLSEIKKRLSVNLDLDFEMPTKTTAGKLMFDTPDTKTAAKLVLPETLSADAFLTRDAVTLNLFHSDRVDSYGWMTGGFVYSAMAFALTAIGLGVYYGIRTQSPNNDANENNILLLGGFTAGLGVFNLIIAIPSFIAYNDTNRSYQLVRK